MEAFLIPAGVVALAELGDKTQLLAFLLAARYRAPLPIIAGILAASLANHGLAGALGAWLATVVNPEIMRWCVGGVFLAVAVWMLLPEKTDHAGDIRPPHFGPFLATLLMFFLAEMGDKTQLATMAMVVHFQAYLPVIAGTVTGMLIANVPAVYIGDKMSHRLPARAINTTAALVFAVLGILVLAGAGEAMAF